MTSHTWQPILSCCPPPKRDAYGYWGDRAAIDNIMPILEPYYSGWLLPEKDAKWVIGEHEGQVFFGRYGKVGDLMGSDYPAAEDNVGRRLEFFLVYSAPAGTPLPRVSDFERIEATMKADIDKFYAELSKAHPYTSDITPSPTAFDFSQGQGETASGHAWDRVASDIEEGKKSTLLVINQQGEVQTHDLARKPPPKNNDRSSSSDREEKKTEESPDRISSHSSSGQSAGYAAFDGGKAVILVSLCALCVGGLAALLYKLRQKKDRHKEQTEAPRAKQLALLSGLREHSSHLRR